jgi:hypothetical protein
MGPQKTVADARSACAMTSGLRRAAAWPRDDVAFAARDRFL